MFQYRNHGADYGRVVVGLQVPEAERGLVPEALDAIGILRRNVQPGSQLYLLTHRS